MQDDKSLHATVMICDALVNTQTHTHTHTHTTLTGYTISLAS